MLNTEIKITKKEYFNSSDAMLEQLIQDVIDNKQTMTFVYENISFEIKEKKLSADGESWEILNGVEAVMLIQIITSDLYDKFKYMMSLDEYTISDIYEFIEINNKKTVNNL